MTYVVFERTSGHAEHFGSDLDAARAYAVECAAAGDAIALVWMGSDPKDNRVIEVWPPVPEPER